MQGRYGSKGRFFTNAIIINQLIMCVQVISISLIRPCDSDSTQKGQHMSFKILFQSGSNEWKQIQMIQKIHERQ